MLNKKAIACSEWETITVVDTNNRLFLCYRPNTFLSQARQQAKEKLLCCCVYLSSSLGRKHDMIRLMRFTSQIWLRSRKEMPQSVSNQSSIRMKDCYARCQQNKLLLVGDQKSPLYNVLGERLHHFNPKARVEMFHR